MPNAPEIARSGGAASSALRAAISQGSRVSERRNVVEVLGSTGGLFHADQVISTGDSDGQARKLDNERPSPQIVIRNAAGHLIEVIQPASICDESEVRTVGKRLNVELNTKHVGIHPPELGTQLVQRRNKPLEIRAIGRSHEVDVAGIPRVTVRDHGDPADDSEIHLVTDENLEHPTRVGWAAVPRIDAHDRVARPARKSSSLNCAQPNERSSR